ncbi:MAG TPA: hypothetical protein PK264_10385 [Hyphomicrobiaceae bacterium]|nr:hypothetical protein [Hyphomicrobiaceae bacterium]
MREFVAIDTAPEPIRIKRTRIQTLLQIANIAITAVVLGAWTFIALFVVEPIGWATWAPVTRGWRPGLFEYPFTMLWGLPLCAVALAWLARRANFSGLNYALLLLPLALLGMIFGWYYLAPSDWL